MAHTPGPWIVEFATDKRGADVIRSVGPVVAGAERGVEIVKLANRMRGPCGDYADNARLIAAAPDLLAACKIALEHSRELMRLWDLELPKDTAAVLEAAIAKATGTK